ncbi:O-antigen ligase family protein [Candidatus Auribacterota bacterium]
MQKKVKLSNILDLFILFSLFMILFLAPLKFGLPFIEGISRLYPEKLVEWIFFSWPKEFGEIFIIFTFTLFLIKCVIQGEFRYRKTPFDIYHLGFLSLLILTTFLSVNKYRSVAFLFQMVSSLLLFYLVIYNLDQREIWLYLSIAILVSTILISLYGLYQYFYGLKETQNWVLESQANGKFFSPAFLLRLSGLRVFSTFVYPNALAGFLVLILPFMVGIYFLQPAQLKYRIFIYTLGISFFGMVIFLYTSEKINLSLVGFLLILGFPFLNLLTLFLTFSKGGFFTLFLIFTCFVYFYFKKGKFKRYKTLIFSLYVIIIILFSYSLFGGRMGEKVTQRIKAPTLQARLGYWRAGLKMIAEKPFLGSGPATYGVLYSHYKLPRAENSQLAHNNYLQIAAETGILGFLFFLLLWGVALKNVLRYFSLNLFTFFKEKTFLERNQKILSFTSGFAILSFAIHGMVDFDLYIPALSMCGWFFLALFCTYSGAVKETLVFRLTEPRKKVLLIILISLAACLTILYIRKNLIADYMFTKGRKEWKNRQKKEAIVSFKRAIQLNSQAAPYHFYLGKIYAEERAYSQAVICLKKAIKRSRLTPYYHYFLGKIYYLLEKTSDKDYNTLIVEELKKAVDYNPTKGSYHLTLAKYYEEKEVIREALVEYKDALVLDPQNEKIKKRIKELSENFERVVDE